MNELRNRLPTQSKAAPRELLQPRRRCGVRGPEVQTQQRAPQHNAAAEGVGQARRPCTHMMSQHVVGIYCQPAVVGACAMWPCGQRLRVACWMGGWAMAGQ